VQQLKTTESGAELTQDLGGDPEELAALFSGENGAYVESLFEDYVTGRDAVGEEWRRLFDRLLGRTAAVGHDVPAPANGAPARIALPHGAVGESLPSLPTGVFALIDAYRTHGHLIAHLDPLNEPETEHPLLAPSEFGLDGDRLDVHTQFPRFLGLAEGTPRELIDALRDTYCRTFAVEFMEMRDKERRDWLVQHMEPHHNRPALQAADYRRILRDVIEAERFEQFLHRRFLGQKRFSIEGGEALIPIMNEICEQAAELDTQELVVAMAHRGRLNVLTHIMGMPYEAVFVEFQKGLIPLDAEGSGDVKYHRGYSADRKTESGRSIHLSLCPNPSHLEAVNPVAEGMVRAKQNLRGDVQRSQVVPILIHGDAAFNGQGLVPETLALSELETYWTGGTIHIIVNNQIGFTTNPKDYRFTRYPSDVAKIIQAPVFHVNADDPIACVHAANLAIRFRQEFKEDVIIDLVCYRRHGHNEGDDPSFTQPLLYKKIRTHPTPATLFSERLLREGVLNQEDVDLIEESQLKRLDRALEQSEARNYSLAGAEGYHGLWKGREATRDSDGEIDTGVSRDTLQRIARSFVELPSGFRAHPKVLRGMEQRAKSISEGDRIDWGGGEALALGSLLTEGTTVRMTGQDVERGTFSHRHAVLHDIETGEIHRPLDLLAAEGASFIIANSLLSEAAVLGFEYGYSWVDPARLVIWEAQFGDFANSAQVIIDQFISSAEQKWNRSSGLVMLLPHGYEGQGPEHSSARLERFLQLCAEDNLYVVNATTPAQIFHALRRQVHAVTRKPLIVMSPKSLLRHPDAVSSLEDFERGHFQTAIDDPAFSNVPRATEPRTVRRVLLCSGKIYYALMAAREEHAFDDVAIIRVEQLHPFPYPLLREILAGYGTRDFVWVQEEPWNMGAWSFVQARLREVVPRNGRVRYVGRPEAASPASGSYRVHEHEESEFIGEAFARRARARRS